jgi:trimethylamine:corrinoid methyltransferase-like protein
VKSVEVMRAQGVSGSVPGIPCDVPPHLQPLVTYRAGAEFSAAGGATHTLHPPQTLRYLFEMAEAMGAPIETAGVFPISPLRLGGHELDAFVEFRDRWRRLWAFSLPALGSTGPIQERAAWVLSVAEALGAALTLHIVSDGKPVTVYPGMYAFDLRALSLAGGAPEHAWMRWVGAQIGRFYNPDIEYHGFITTQAKRPGAQAGAEKAIGGTFAILTGCDGLEYAGALGFDDIFSPEQMVLDREMVDALEHLSHGVPRGDPDAWIDLVRQGAESGYLQTDMTLDTYRDTYWLPQVFDRLTWPSFRSAGGRHARERATEKLRSMLTGYTYQPPAAIEDVRRIFREAWRALGGDTQADYLALLDNE